MTPNYGKSGLEEAKSQLEKRSISHTGSGNLVLKEIRGTKFGFLGFEFIGKDIVEEEKLPIYMSSWSQPKFVNSY